MQNSSSGAGTVRKAGDGHQLKMPGGIRVEWKQ